jgi:hypothetical protein
VTHAWAARRKGLSRLLLSEEVQSLDALPDSTLLSNFVERLVLLFDVVLIFIVNVHISALNISKACKQLESLLPKVETIEHTFKLSL